METVTNVTERKKEKFNVLLHVKRLIVTGSWWVSIFRVVRLTEEFSQKNPQAGTFFFSSSFVCLFFSFWFRHSKTIRDRLRVTSEYDNNAGGLPSLFGQPGPH